MDMDMGQREQVVYLPAYVVYGLVGCRNYCSELFLLLSLVDVTGA